MVRASDVASSWPDRLSFTVTWNHESVRVQTRLCGSHWVPVVLAAVATGVALGVPLEMAAEAIAGVEPFEARMSPVTLDDGVTFIRDDWKAPWWTIAPSFEFMRTARARRKIIVIGTISDYSGDSARRYVQVGRQALEVANIVVFVGPWSSSSLRAKRDPSDKLLAFGSVREAASYLSNQLQEGDLVLLKGSTRADHLERLILSRIQSLACWRSDCGRWRFCNECNFINVPSGTTLAAISAKATEGNESAVEAGTTHRPIVGVVGLGNHGARYADTPHNVGHDVIDMLAEQLAGDWTPEGDLAMAMRASWKGNDVCLLKLLTSVNDAGATLFPLAQRLGLDIKLTILVHDDLDLPLGAVRTRMRGGAGGHRGVQWIVEAFQEDKIRRVKIGVGRPAPGTAILDYVLTPFPPEQRTTVASANRAAADRVLELIANQVTFPLFRPRRPSIAPAQACPCHANRMIRTRCTQISCRVKSERLRARFLILLVPSSRPASIPQPRRAQPLHAVNNMPKSLDSRVPNVTDRVADLAHEVRAGIEWRVGVCFPAYRQSSTIWPRYPSTA